MTKQELTLILKRYAEGKASKKEIALLQLLYLKAMAKQEDSTTANAYQDIQGDMWEAIRNETVPKIRLIKRSKIGIVAAAITVFLGLWFLYSEYNSSDSIISPAELTNRDTMSSKEKIVTLTLGNGDVYQLDHDKREVMMVNGKAVYSDGREVADFSERQKSDSKLPANILLTLTVPRGVTYQVALEDGTNVWLNSESSLSYSSSIAKDEQRRVILKGEGYFEVAKRANKPFIVESDGQEIEVLGTHFNVNSYKDGGELITTLLEGSVKVNGALLKPNQQSILSSKGQLIRQADLESVMAWKEGKFYFNGCTIEAVMAQLARWYDVEVVYVGERPTDNFVGRINRSSDIHEVLKKIEMTNRVRFKLERGKVIVKK